MARSRTREPGFSMFRIGVLAAVFGVVVVIGGAILFSLEQAGQRQPLDIDPPPGAELRLQEDGVGTSRRLYYFVSETTAEQVADYYNQKMVEFYGRETNTERCRRIPSSGNFDGYVEGSGRIPYSFRCLFDSSSFQSDRFTQVDIQPGVRNDATGVNNEGSVIIEYFQQWQP